MSSLNHTDIVRNALINKTPNISNVGVICLDFQNSHIYEIKKK